MFAAPALMCAASKRSVCSGCMAGPASPALPPPTCDTNTCASPPAGMPDIERLTRKLEARRASLADLCQLYRASSVLPRLEEALRCHEVEGGLSWGGGQACNCVTT